MTALLPETATLLPDFDADGPVVARRDGNVLHLVLNRPGALNALNHPMISGLRAGIALGNELARAAAEQGTPTVRAIVLSGAGERAFSAGGDLKFLHTDAIGTGDKALPLWADLYALVADIDASGVPVVSLMDGIVFGGGLGVAGRCHVRVATERSVIGMPETRIGFYPDTGGLSLLEKCVGEVGTYLGTCAQSVGGHEAVRVGLADHYVPSSDMPAFVEAINVLGLDEALSSFSTLPSAHGDDAPRLPAAWVDECFAGDDPVVILERLRAHDHPDAAEAADLYASRAPSAVAVTLKALRTVAHLDLAEDLALELRMTDRLRRTPDFIEGVRARVVDKDRDPSWQHAHVSDVDAAWVEQIVS